MFNYKRNKHGFTLVELSIVLVIIGLLIGGILVAQSMIETAKLNALVKTLQQYEIAATNFRTNYGDLPGDSNKISPAGNNDGQIGPTYGNAEFFEVWNQLYNTGHIQESYAGQAGYAGFTASNDWTGLTPPLKYGKGCFLIMESAQPEAAAPNTRVAFAITSPYFYSAFNVTNFMGCMTSAEALAVDSKLDDAVADTGKVMVMWPGTGIRRVGYGGGDTTASGCTANAHPLTGVYDVEGNWFSHSGNVQEPDGKRPDRRDCPLSIEVDGLN